MTIEPTSQHLRNAHELFLLVPLKSGFVEGTERLTSYASRLRALLELLFAPTQSSVEKTLMPTATSIEILQNIYDFHYGVVDRFHRPHLILSATFDSSWETYFHNLVDEVGPFLDALFCHCEGFEGRTCVDGYEAFADFIREHQVQSGIFYSALPDLTVDDVRLSRRLARGGKLGEPIGSVEDEVVAAREYWEKQGEQLQGEDFKRLKEQSYSCLVRALWELRTLFPAREEAPGARRAVDIFDRAASQLVDPYRDEIVAIRTLPKELKEWLGRPYVDVVPAPKNAPTLRDERANIQGNILAPYPRAERGLLLLVQLPEVREERVTLLRTLEKMLTTDELSAAAKVRLNVGFTYAGLERLQLNEDVLALFPKEFREGMEARAGLLGDVGWPNHPEYWSELESNWPEQNGGRFPMASIDIVLTLQAQSADVGRDVDDAVWSPRHPLKYALDGVLRSAPALATGIVRIEALRRSKVGHFGATEPSKHESQPALRMKGEPPQQGDGYHPAIALGELLLGYDDGRGEVARCADPHHNPDSCDLFKDGSFLVIRKLRQHSKVFETYLEREARRIFDDVDEKGKRKVASWLLGRDDRGRTLARPHAHGADPINAFDYQADDGSGCPLHSHARRMNPRTAGVPRIVRRSFTYGCDYQPKNAESEAEDRGLFFMAYNASIAQQFEVLQRWVSGGNSTGLLSTKADLFAGGRPPPGTRYPVPGGGELIAPERPFVTLSWGLYLFAPSRRALSFLAEQVAAEGEGVPALARTEKFGARLVRELDGIKDRDTARLAWKELLEEASRKDDAEAVWRTIRAAGGRKETPYGLLVGDAAGAQQVLADDGKKFSIREYWRRLTTTVGEHYLGFDLEPGTQAEPYATPDDSLYEARAREVSYRELATIPNMSLRARVAPARAFREAKRAADNFIEAAPRGFLPSRGGEPDRQGFDLRHLAKAVVGELAHSWVGLPSSALRTADATRDFLQNFTFVSRYTFFPHPDPWLYRAARDAGAALRAGYAHDEVLECEMARDLLARGYQDPELIRSAMMGALVGFVPPAVALIVSILNEWMQNGDLEQVARSVAAVAADEDGDKTRAMLLGRLLETMKSLPMPPVLYRTALAGNGLTTPGAFVAVSLHSACVDARERGDPPLDGQQPAWRWLFGGENSGQYGGGTATHGCPMRDPAVSTILGILAAVAPHAPFTREGPLLFSYGA